MLTFTEYTQDPRNGFPKIDIDPAEVESVSESERKITDAGWQRVSIITMKSGVKHIVRDHDARRKIASAKAILYEQKMEHLHQRIAALERAQREGQGEL